MLLVTSCNAEKVRTPGGVRIDIDSQQVKWNKVSGAYSYDVSIGEDTINTKANFFSLEYLAPGEYEIKVRAVSFDEEILPSEWVSVPFEREAETGLKYKLINNRTEYELIGAGTASGDVVMESVYRGKPVTSIAKKALTNNKRITSFVVGDYVKTIGESAFSRCSALTSVTIPESVVSMGEYVFQSSKALTEVNFNAKVTEIPGYTFSWCSAIESITLGDTVRNIGVYAFSNCTGLTTLNVSASLETIGEYAFSDCTSLSALNLPGIKNIGPYVFYNCSAIDTVSLGEALISIGDAAFTNCTSITKLTLPDSTETIGIESFAHCTSLGSITVGNKITAIGTNAFADTKYYDEGGDTVYVGGWIIAYKNKAVKSISLKAGTYGIGASVFSECTELVQFNLTGIKYVGEAAFYGCEKLRDIKFSNDLLKVGNYAFSSCPVLLYVDLGQSLTHIGNYAFTGCSALTGSTKLPPSLVSIGTYAFHGTQAYTSATDVVYVGDWAVGLKPSSIGFYQGMTIKKGTRGIADYCFYSNSLVTGTITIPEGVEHIGRAAFYDSMFTSAFMLPTTLKTIGDYAFYGCSGAWFGNGGITVIPSGVTHIGRSAFYGCAAMVGLVVPGTVKEIAPYAFYGCVNLGESSLHVDGIVDNPTFVGYVTLGEGIEVIGERAFFGCERIAELVIPDSVTTIGLKAFYKCLNLRKLTIGTGVQSISEYAFYKCTSLEELNMPEGIKTIGKYAFRGCESLTSIIIPEGLTSIGANAFSGASSATEIKLPNSLTSIGDYAFRGASNVKSVIIPESVAVIGKHAFYGCAELTIYCESEKIMPEWSERFNSAYRPIVFGCTLSPDKSYVVSFTTGEDAIDNTIAENGALFVEREGYELVGWATTPDATVAVYTPTEALLVEDGTTLYTVWNPIITE